MPTGTSTIFGVFQVIRELQVGGTVAALNFVGPHGKWRKPSSSAKSKATRVASLDLKSIRAT
jgi:hypothetical protein